VRKRLVRQSTFGACPPLKYLLVPGGMGTRSEVSNTELIRFVSDKAADCGAVL